MKRDRNYGLDLLKVLSMLMIIILHSLGHGGVLRNLETTTAQYKVAWLLEVAAYCGVNCYALISGYVATFKANFKFSNLLRLWIQVVFYNLILSIWGTYYSGNHISWDLITTCLTPVTSCSYWYFTAYAGMYLFLPFVGSVFDNIPRKQLQRSIAAFILIFSILPTFQNIDTFQLRGGYHALWLLLLYLIGAYIKRYPPLEKIPIIIWLLIYAAMVFLSWYNLLVNNNRISANPDLQNTLVNLVQYTSPTILFAAIALLLFFSRLCLSERLKSIAASIAPLTFGVYLIHDNKYVRSLIISNSLSGIVDNKSAVIVGKVLLFAICVYAICLLLEALRSWLFDMLHVKDFTKRID